MSGQGGAKAASLWPEIAKAFPNRAFMRISPSWFSGLAPRVTSSRLERLQSTPPALKLRELTAGLDAARMRQLLAYSEVNLDQAVAALRLTLIVNISVPVGFLVLFNQFLPGRIQDFIGTMPSMAVLVPLALMLSVLVGILWFAYAGVDAARDLNHLLRLRLAETGGRGEEDEGGMESVVTELS